MTCLSRRDRKQLTPENKIRMQPRSRERGHENEVDTHVQNFSIQLNSFPNYLVI